MPSDDTLAGARLAEAGARGICSPTVRAPCANTCDECERQARAAIRAQTEAAGLTAEDLDDAASDMEDALSGMHVARFLRAMAEVLRDE